MYIVSWSQKSIYSIMVTQKPRRGKKRKERRGKKRKEWLKGCRRRTSTFTAAKAVVPTNGLASPMLQENGPLAQMQIRVDSTWWRER
jgi:hypothetical protein